MKNLTDKETLQLYGRIVEDFVNSQDSDEAYLSIIKGIQKAFNFSSNFTKKAIKYFPSLKKIGSNLNEKELELLKLCSKDFCAQLIILELTPIPLQNTRYDLEKDKLVLSPEWDAYDHIYIDIDFDEKNSNDFIKQFEKYIPNEFFHEKSQEDSQELLEGAKTYRDLQIKIKALLNTVSEIEYSKIELILDSGIFEKHGHIVWLQKEIQIILTRIMEGQSLHEILSLGNILYQYNQRYEKHLVIHPDGTFSDQTSLLGEEDYTKLFNSIKEYDSIEYVENDHYLEKRPIDSLGTSCLKWYSDDILYIFIEFLRLSNQRNLANICNLCKKYFISQKDDNRIKYCPSCSPKSKMSRERKNELQRIWRQKKKQAKIKKEREAKILNFMDKLGCTRKEAEEIIEADESMM